jgi:hypothetical protein
VRGFIALAHLALLSCWDITIDKGQNSEQIMQLKDHTTGLRVANIIE